MASTVSRIDPPASFGPLKRTYIRIILSVVTYIYKSADDALNKMDLNWIRFGADAIR